MKKAAAIRAQVEAALGPGFPSPFQFREFSAPETVSWAVPEIDALTGGLPRGSLTEICGPPSSGRTRLMLSMLAGMTAREEACAWVDARDAFDPCSAAVAGVEPGQLLWVRCHSLEQTLRAADLLVQGGGFGLVAVDLADVPFEIARRVPLSSWFRFRRAVENTPTVLVLVEQEPCAKSCASLVLRLGVNRAYWSTAEGETRDGKVSHACLLRGTRPNVEVVRDRNVRVYLHS